MKIEDYFLKTKITDFGNIIIMTENRDILYDMFNFDNDFKLKDCLKFELLKAHIFIEEGKIQIIFIVPNHYSKKIKEIRFYLYDYDDDNFIENYSSFWNTIKSKINTDENIIINTHQLLCLNPKLATEYGYNIIIIENSTSKFSITFTGKTIDKLKVLDCDRTNRILTENSCLYKLLLSGEFKKK